MCPVPAGRPSRSSRRVDRGHRVDDPQARGRAVGRWRRHRWGDGHVDARRMDRTEVGPVVRHCSLLRVEELDMGTKPSPRSCSRLRRAPGLICRRAASSSLSIREVSQLEEATVLVAHLAQGDAHDRGDLDVLGCLRRIHRAGIGDVDPVDRRGPRAHVAVCSPPRRTIRRSQDGNASGVRRFGSARRAASALCCTTSSTASNAVNRVAGPA